MTEPRDPEYPPRWSCDTLIPPPPASSPRGTSTRVSSSSTGAKTSAPAGLDLPAERVTPADDWMAPPPSSRRIESSPASSSWHDDARRALTTIRRFRVSVVEGQDGGAFHESTSDRCSIGSHPLNDLVVSDPTVSRFHCEIHIEAEGALVNDLKSRNGTMVDGVQVREAFLRGGSLLRLGRVVVRFELGTQRNQVPVSPRDRFGPLVGNSLAMRSSFALMERAAASDVTVLIEGETGTGKGKAAGAIHQESARRHQPFVVIDCGVIHKDLLESELFGHEKGAFTGADTRRIGAFEEASGGTVFLDEVGELPPDFQPKLLRVLENREFRRLGTNRFLRLDVRIIAATNRDLRAEVNAGRFRSDLYFRLAVLKLPIPPLRARPEDIPTLVGAILESIGPDPEAHERMLAPDFIAALQRSVWPGNVRELRNYIERCVIVDDSPPLQEMEPGPLPDAFEELVPFAEARQRSQAQFERSYLERLLRRFEGKVARAATAAEMDRVHLYRLLRRHGIKPGA